MKKIIGVAVFLAAIMLLLPLSVLKETPKVLATSAVIKQTENKTQTKPSETFKVYDCESQKITEMTAEEYIFGVVSAEMPALYEPEALKAQAVAAYTFACSRKTSNKDKDYDITTDHTVDQSYISETAAREKWGENADEYISKIKNAVKEAAGYVITYKGSLITSVYHAISSGRTESCKDVWGEDLPYLVAVSSEGDKLVENYISKAVFTQQELKLKLASKVSIPDDSAISFGEITRTDSGNVKKIKVCAQELSGSDIRSILDLRSANFQIESNENQITFTVYGYGHGVGMSQNGANYMAKQGCDFKEILTHYYKDCSVGKM